MFDVEKIRKDFPILEEKIYGKPLVYLDSGATTQRPQIVVDRMAEYYLKYNANVHRGVHYLSNKCTDANEETRRLVRDFINANSEREIIFTRGTTESINLVAYSFGEAFVKAGDSVVVTEMEHHANIVPWQMLCERKGAELRVIPFSDNGELDLTYLSLIDETTKMVGIAHVSNTLGTINPIKQVIDYAHAQGAKVLIDAAQGVQHLPTDVQALDCDFLVFSGHKLYGPTGVGVLYGKEELLEQMPPWQGGGEMIKEVRFEKTTYNELPFKFEAGTPDFIGIVGLGEAIKYIQHVGMAEIAAYEHDLINYAMAEVSSIPYVRIYGTATHKSSVVSFLADEIHHFDMGMMLDRMGIAVRTGQLCAEPVMQHYGITGVVRASLGMYNTREEIDALCEGIRKVGKMFGKE
ncbi:MAG: aminotransferase class V-fold PLP-dependent enzyme [Marinifilaceae bacterium]